MTRRDGIILAAIMLIAAALRLEDIRQPLVDAFSWREASTAMMADNFHQHSANIFYPQVSWTGAEPGYQGRELAIVSYISAGIYAVVGWHDWIGRAVAAMFGLWTVFALHRLSARVWNNDNAHATAAMYAVLPGAVFIDRSFLPDPSMLALVTTGAWLFVMFLQRGRSYLLPVSTAIFTIGALAKLPGMAVAVPIFGGMVRDLWGAAGGFRPKLVKYVLATGFSLIAVGLYYGWAIYLGNTYSPYHVSGSGYIWQDGIANFAAQGFYLSKTSAVATIWFATTPILMLAGIGALFAPPESGKPAALGLGWFFHLWLLGAAAIYFLAAREISVNVWNYHIFSVPLAAFAGRGLLLVAAAAGGRADQFGGVARAIAVYAVVIVTATLPAITIMKRPLASSGMELGNALSVLSLPGDYVIAVGPQVGDPVAIYYSRRHGWNFPPAGGQYDWSVLVDNATAISQLAAMKAAGAKWFGVTKNARDSQGRLFLEHHKELLEHLDKTATRDVDNDVFVIYRLGN